MKKLEIEKYGLQALGDEDAKMTNGGFIATVIAGCMIAAFVEVIRDWDNFERGLKGEPYNPDN